MKKPFNHRIRQHKPEWDKDAFWDKLEPELPRPAKKRLAWWYWIGLLLLLVGIGVYAWPYDPGIQALPIPLSSRISVDKGIAVFDESEPYPTVIEMEEQPSAIGENTNEQGTTQALKNKQAGLQKGIELLNTPNEKPAIAAERPLTPYIPRMALPQVDRPKENAANPYPALPPVETLTMERLRIADAAMPPLAYATEETTEQGQLNGYQTLSFLTAFSTIDDLSTTINEGDWIGQPRESIGVEYSVGVQHSSGWYAQAGVSWQQRRALLEWEGVVDSSSIIQNSGQAFSYTDANGQTLYQSGEVESTVLTRRRIVQQNYFRTLDVPVSVGYRWQFARWSGMAQLGMRVNLQHKFSGKWVVPAQGILEQRRINEELLRSSLGLGWSAAVGAAYQLGTGVELYGQMHFQQFQVYNVRGQTYMIPQRLWGVRIGVRDYF